MSRLSNYLFFSKLVLFPLLLLAVTLALITLSFIHEIKSADISAVEFATIEARASYARDFAYRTWASMHGGVYVEINDRVKPNPYLEVPNREIYADGKVYTLINPAYMNRQVYELDTINLLKTKITSLKPLNPNNTPDEWEEKALKIFEDGVDEVVSVETIEDEDYLRLIKPFYVEESCLKCHGKQGYKIGQVRGGISISIPMSYYYDIAKTHSNGTLISHSAAFIFILLLYFWWYAIYRKQSLREATLKEKLVLQKNDLIEVNSELVRSKLKVEENEAFLKAALENSQAGIVIADMPDGEILFANKAGLLINDDKEYDDIEKYSDINKIVSSWQILHFDGTPYKSNEVPLTRAVLYGETNSKEFIIRRENYEDKFVWANVAPIIDKNGIQIAAINVFLDITELKKAQDHLKEKNQQLSELNKEYLHAKQLAEESERLKAAFLANISHEIRTPMNGIMGFLQLLKTTKSSDKFYTKYMDIITLSGDRLLTTINDIIQISRIESGQVSVVKEVVDISEFLKYLLDFFEPQAQKKGTNLTLISDFGKDENIITDVSKLDSI